jgi:hypothetical protein
MEGFAHGLYITKGIPEQWKRASIFVSKSSHLRGAGALLFQQQRCRKLPPGEELLKWQEAQPAEGKAGADDSRGEAVDRTVESRSHGLRSRFQLFCILQAFSPI